MALVYPAWYLNRTTALLPPPTTPAGPSPFRFSFPSTPFPPPSAAAAAASSSLFFLAAAAAAAPVVLRLVPSFWNQLRGPLPASASSSSSSRAARGSGMGLGSAWRNVVQ